MKPSLAFAKSFALILLLTLLSFKPFAQSTPTSKKGEIPPLPKGEGAGGEVALYHQNARAILDSLLRYQDVKVNLQLKNKQITTYQSQLTGCQVQNSKLRSDANEMAIKLFDANEAYNKKRKKLLAANLEKWTWRVAAALILTFSLTQK